MRLLFLGDIVGKTARISLAKNLLIIKEKLRNKARLLAFFWISGWRVTSELLHFGKSQAQTLATELLIKEMFVPQLSKSYNPKSLPDLEWHYFPIGL